MVFQHAIRLATFDKDEYTFTSFWGNNRDNCYDLILKTRDRVLLELRPTAVNSSESRYPVLPTSPMSRVSSSSSTPHAQSDAEHDEEDEEEKREKEQRNLDYDSDHDESVVPTAGIGAIETAVEEASNDQTAPATPRRRSVVSDVDSIAPKDISMTQILEEEFPLSVNAFMQTFFLDNASFGLDKFGEQTGSTEMTVNPWMTPLEEEKSFGTCACCRLVVIL
ncbi:unnamed protein product [Phytophthora fragariaefolia]|uniref:Unnamed protein product n=1 Tax=Phytophthora fragariaefolia TaxID=1490495 RepID=A0A9W6XXA1_9STRA|nr:unnamed protein product [Phytophthora fragariaefolia]